MANRNPSHPWRKQSRFFSTKPAKPNSGKQKPEDVSRGTIPKGKERNGNS